MRIILSSIIVLFLSTQFFGCKQLKEINKYERNYYGNLNIFNKEKNYFKFNAKYDSLNILKLKLYSITGIKIGDFTLFNDSLLINYIINNDFKKIILKYFKELNSKICLNYFIISLLESTEAEFKENKLCYNLEKNILKGNPGNNTVFLYSKDYEKILSIKLNKRFLKKSNLSIFLEDKHDIKIDLEINKK